MALKHHTDVWLLSCDYPSTSFMLNSQWFPGYHLCNTAAPSPWRTSARCSSVSLQSQYILCLQAASPATGTPPSDYPAWTKLRKQKLLPLMFDCYSSHNIVVCPSTEVWNWSTNHIWAFHHCSSSSFIQEKRISDPQKKKKTHKSLNNKSVLAPGCCAE